ncbi:MAG: 50S ribosomal protein L11 methyltransferase [Pseudomonadota bacterium]
MSERWPQIIVIAARDELDALEESLFDFGALSVTAEDAGHEPILEPPLGTTPRWQRTRLRALFERGASLASRAAQLSQCFPHHEFQIDDSLADRDWVREWMEHFKPMRFGDRLWVLPQHSPDEAASGSAEQSPVIVRLDPGLAFGTGTHPSTASCLRWLDAHGSVLRAPGSRVLDYGCGSGILSVAAAKLGATRVCAVDLDPQALLATAQNARRNQVLEQLAIMAPEPLAASAYDVVLANILAGPLITLASRLATLTRPAGHLKLAGILREQAAAVVDAYRPWFDVSAEAIDEQWARVEGVRRTPSARVD